MNDLSKNFQTGQRFTLRVHQIEGSVKYQSQTTAYTCVSLIAGVHFVEVFMGRGDEVSEGHDFRSRICPLLLRQSVFNHF